MPVSKRLGAKQEDSNSNNNQNQLPGDAPMSNELTNVKVTDVDVLFDKLLNDYTTTKENNATVLETVSQVKEATKKLNQEFEEKLINELEEIKEMNDISNTKVNLILSERITTMLETKQASQESIVSKANAFKAKFSALVG